MHFIGILPFTAILDENKNSTKLFAVTFLYQTFLFFGFLFFKKMLYENRYDIIWLCVHFIYLYTFNEKFRNAFALYF